MKASLRLKFWCAGALLAAAMAPAAHAEVWGWVDGKGVAHFAADKVDERYELFFRGGESFDTARGLKTPREVAVPTAAPKLIAFFEVSQGFKQVQHHLREASRDQGIDYELLKALIATESGFDSSAVSPKGAVGLMQVMPATAQRYGVTSDKKSPVEKKLHDPRTNIKAGTRYLRYLLDLFPGQVELALAAYNAGEGAVQRAGNKIPNYRETQNYVKTVMQLYTMLKPPSVVGNGRVPHRVHVELPAGGAVGRGNLPPPGVPAMAYPVPVAPSPSSVPVAAAGQADFQ
ncbi:lytic transglycosylase domain-containing protein [Caenimonas aquaedulcis]|uniref:Lytic transglycosylase domain-containing protein n=1 Tax=Caenimonas aquaedulcis TaxID=2793270 RepID=A0A931H2V9_9BURK|nr:lytic transglycosylase domain-containing protein [Caenimonas aquaedulcis]MBG9387562.1 lytic transglycosylase domain-containing protein [Caenimonas aquaedulcis]